MKKIDMKSLLVGMILGVCILFALGAAPGDRADIGKYQIVCSDSAGTCFVIDTTTGQIWRKYAQGKVNDLGSPGQWKK